MTEHTEKRKKRKSYKRLAITELVIILGLVCGLSWDLFIRDRGSSNNEQTVPASKQITTSSGEDPGARTKAVIEKEETFYQLSGKKILYNDGALGQVYLPVFENVPACSLDMNDLVTRNGYSFYRENGNITSIAGIDISEYQHDINWEQVKAAGVDFAMIRVGYRTYGGGELNFDTKFKENIEQADAAGIKVGVYFFSQAVTTEEAIEEADFVLDAIKPYNITYPVVFDWELIYGETARTDSVTVDMLADCCVSFCERVKSAGYTPMIYQNKNTSLMKLDLPRLTGYDFWLAEYNTAPTYYYDFQMWQYSSSGYIPGIDGRVDMNICFKDYSAPAQEKTTEATSEPTTAASSETTAGTTAETTSAASTTTAAATTTASAATTTGTTTQAVLSTVTTTVTTTSTATTEKK